MKLHSQSGNVFALIVIFQMFCVFSERSPEVLKASNLMSKFQDSSKSKAAYCNGLPGLPGRDGRDGRDASLRGPPGRKGAPGPKGDAGGSTGSVVYTRWGRKLCPTTSKTSLLYSGFMAGSDHGNSGGGANYLCLPQDPIYDKVLGGHQGSSYIYGAEYQVSSFKNFFPKLHDHDPSCVVCHAESRGSYVMIPARNVCPSGWTLEYKGYLMSELYNHKGRTQYICVDGDPKATFGTHADRNGALLYFVEGVCGSLPCGPYKSGYELTCVVCTK